MAKKIVSYNEAFARLQEIQIQIEGNKLDVDELTFVLKEAAELLKFCKDKLLIVDEETKKIIEDIQ